MRLSPARRWAVAVLPLAASLALASCGGGSHVAVGASASPPIIRASPNPSVEAGYGKPAPRVCAAYAEVVTIEAHRSQIADASASQLAIANSTLAATTSVIIQAQLTPKLTLAAQQLADHPIQAHVATRAGTALATLQAGLAPRCPGF